MYIAIQMETREKVYIFKVVYTTPESILLNAFVYTMQHIIIIIIRVDFYPGIYTHILTTPPTHTLLYSTF